MCLHIISIVSSNLWTPCHFSGLYDAKHLQLVNHEQSQFEPRHYHCTCKHWKTHGISLKVFAIYIVNQIRSWGIVNTSTILKNRKSPQLPIVEDHWDEPCILLDSSVMSQQWKICHCQKDLILGSTSSLLCPRNKFLFRLAGKRVSIKISMVGT